MLRCRSRGARRGRKAIRGAREGRKGLRVTGWDGGAEADLKFEKGRAQLVVSPRIFRSTGHVVGHEIGSMSSISVMSTAHSSGSRCHCSEHDDSGRRCVTCSGQRGRLRQNV